MTDAVEDLRRALRDLVHETLPQGLPPGWPDERPLVEAGLDSVAVLQLVAALEERWGRHLDDADLSAENFATLAALERLAARAGRPTV